MIGLNSFIGSEDVRVFRKPEADSWGDGNAQYHHTLESVGVAARTTTGSSNQSFRERVASGYTLYLDDEQVGTLRESDEIEIVMPDGSRAYYTLDGYRWGTAWTKNPLSSFDMGNEVNVKFLRAEVV